MSDRVRAAVLEYLQRPSTMLCHPDDTLSKARALLMGFEPVITQFSILPEDRIARNRNTEERLAEMVRMSETDADMFDACKQAVTRLRQQPLPAPLAAWNLDWMNDNRRRPTKRGGAKEDRLLKNVERDIKICGAVALAAKLGNLPEYARWYNDEKSACHVVSECLIELYNQGNPAGAGLGYPSVKKIWLKRCALICSRQAVDVLTGKPID